MAYAKALLKEQLLDERLSSDPMVSKEIESTLPARLASEFRDPLYDHKLKGELIATHIANNLVNQMGATFMKRLEDASGADPVEIAVSWLAVEEIFELKPLWLAIEALDYKVAADIQMEMMLELVRLSRGANALVVKKLPR